MTRDSLTGDREFPVFGVVVLDEDLALLQSIVTVAGGVVRRGYGRRIDRELEVARQIRVEELHGADDLVDLPGCGASDIAHDRRLGDSIDGDLSASE